MICRKCSKSDCDRAAGPGSEHCQYHYRKCCAIWSNTGKNCRARGMTIVNGCLFCDFHAECERANIERRRKFLNPKETQ